MLTDLTASRRHWRQTHDALVPLTDSAESEIVFTDVVGVADLYPTSLLHGIVPLDELRRQTATSP